MTVDELVKVLAGCPVGADVIMEVKLGEDCLRGMMDGVIDVTDTLPEFSVKRVVLTGSLPEEGEKADGDGAKD